MESARVSRQPQCGRFYQYRTKHWEGCTYDRRLPWHEDSDEHLESLREKLNTYLQFIKCGELLETYPKAKDRDVIINVAGKFPLTEEAAEFYRNAGSINDRMGIGLRFELLKPSAKDISSETKPS